MKKSIFFIVFSVLFLQLCAAATVTTIDPSGSASVTYSFAAAGANTNTYISIPRGSTINSATISAVGARNPAVPATIDAAVSVEESSMIQHTNGYMYIAYYDTAADDLYLANQTAAGWVTGTIDTGGDVGGSPSMIQAADGNLYIAYYDTTNGDLKLANQTIGGWVNGIIDPAAGYNPEGISMIQAADNNLYIAYYDFTARDLKLANQTGVATWVLGTIDTVGDVGASPSLIQAADNNLYISYYDITNDNLKLANQTGVATWATGIVDASGPGGANLGTSLVQATDTFFYISYYENLGADLKLANQTGPATWVLGTVDTAGTTGAFSSMVQGTDGNLYISYTSVFPPLLRLAANTSSSAWVTGTLDGGVGCGFPSLLESTAQGLHVSYQGTPAVLNYTSKTFPETFVLRTGSTNVLNTAVLNATSRSVNIANAVSNYMTASCFTATCQVPIVLTTNSAGNATLSSLNVNYDPAVAPPPPPSVVTPGGSTGGTDSSGGSTESGGSDPHYEIITGGKDSASDLLLNFIDKLPTGIFGIKGDVYSYSTLKVVADDSAHQQPYQHIQMKFSVLKSWLETKNIEPSEIKLNSYKEGIWSELPTKLIEETADSFVYLATLYSYTDYLSVAARAGDCRDLGCAAGEKCALVGNEHACVPESYTCEIISCPFGQALDTTTCTCVSSDFGGVVTGIVVILIVAVFLVGYFFIIKKQ